MNDIEYIQYLRKQAVALKFSFPANFKRYNSKRLLRCYNGIGAEWVRLSTKDRLIGSANNKIKLPKQFSLCARVQISTVSGDDIAPMIAFGEWEGRGEYETFGLCVARVSGVSVRYSGDNWNEFQNTLSVGDVPHSVSLTADGTTARMWVDGVQVGEVTSSNLADSDTLAPTLLMFADSSRDGWLGSMSKVGIWGRELAQHEVKQLAMNVHNIELPKQIAHPTDKTEMAKCGWSVTCSNGSLNGYDLLTDNNEASSDFSAMPEGSWVHIVAPYSFKLTGLRIYNTKSNSVRNFHTMLVQGSNDGSTWQDITTIEGEDVGYMNAQTFPIDCEESYSNYKLTFTEAYNNESIWVTSCTLYTGTEQ